jgi:hypothetical protein
MALTQNILPTINAPHVTADVLTKRPLIDIYKKKYAAADKRLRELEEELDCLLYSVC